jgi:tetratricopeptide (TPR) repeat protein
VTQQKTERIRGVFSSQEIRKVGTGTTTRKSVAKTFWYVEEDEHGKIFVQPVNSNYVPTGNKKLVSKDELIAKFFPEPEFYIQSVLPKMRHLSETLERADSAREKGETFSAEFEYGTALQLDEDSVRANFGIGLTYLARGETDKADNILSRLLNLEGAFSEEQKFLFNEFGINLRKNKMLQQSLNYYQRALDLAKADENLFLNIARLYLEMKDMPHCLEFLGKVFQLAPGNEIALKFLDWLEARRLVTPEQASGARSGPAVPKEDNPAQEPNPDAI